MSDLFDPEKLAEGYLSYQPIRGNACRKVPVTGNPSLIGLWKGYADHLSRSHSLLPTTAPGVHAGIQFVSHLAKEWARASEESWNLADGASWLSVQP